MKIKIMIIIAALTISACSSSEYSDADYDVAMTAFNAQENVDEVCESLWQLDQEEVKKELKLAYDNGKPDGVIWTNVDISPTIKQVYALVDIMYDHCRQN